MSKWTNDEQMLIRAYYQEHGPSWVGWSEILPDRSESAIRHQAGRLGMLTTNKRDAAFVYRPDTNDIMRLFRMGLPPSVIDMRLGLQPDEARGVITAEWRREWDEHGMARYK